jgi:AraC-like DNA-binding protein
MKPDLSELVKRVDAQLAAHPNASLKIVAARLGTTEESIEEALERVEGLTFQEYQDDRRLAQAFRQLGEYSPAADGPYEMTRARRRFMIPRATVQYRPFGFWKRKAPLSDRCPLVDLSQDGLAFLNDQSVKPGKRLWMLLKLPDEAEPVLLTGIVVYAVATGIAGYRYRIGIRFLPFGDRRNGNSRKSLDIIIRIEEAHSA